MRGLVRTVIGLGAAALWLVLLEATDFNGATIGVGLLVGFGMIDGIREAT